MPFQPGANLRLLMGGVIVEDDVDGLIFRQFSLDGVEEADELLMPVALHVAADDGAVENIEGSKQGRGAMTFIIMGHRAAPALFQGQTRLRPVE